MLTSVLPRGKAPAAGRDWGKRNRWTKWGPDEASLCRPLPSSASLGWASPVKSLHSWEMKLDCKPLRPGPPTLSFCELIGCLTAHGATSNYKGPPSSVIVTARWEFCDLCLSWCSKGWGHCPLGRLPETHAGPVMREPGARQKGTVASQHRLQVWEAQADHSEVKEGGR